MLKSKKNERKLRANFFLKIIAREILLGGGIFEEEILLFFYSNSDF